MSVLAIAAFIEALMDNCVKFEKCISFYVEQMEYCYETGPFSAGLPDRNFHRLIWIKSPGQSAPYIQLHSVSKNISILGSNLHFWNAWVVYSAFDAVKDVPLKKNIGTTLFPTARLMAPHFRKNSAASKRHSVHLYTNIVRLTLHLSEKSTSQHWRNSNKNQAFSRCLRSWTWQQHTGKSCRVGITSLEWLRWTLALPKAFSHSHCIGQITLAFRTNILNVLKNSFWANKNNAEPDHNTQPRVFGVTVMDTVSVKNHQPFSLRSLSNISVPYRYFGCVKI